MKTRVKDMSDYEIRARLARIKKVQKDELGLRALSYKDALQRRSEEDTKAAAKS